MKLPLTVRIFGRRRNILINSPYQHRVSLLTTLLAMLPPSIFFGVYYLITAEGSRQIVEASPSLEQLVRSQDRTESLLILAAVLFYGLGVYLVTLLESHRTAGFLYRVERFLQELRDGRYGGRVNPRRDDNFTFLAHALNEVSANLRRRTEEDLALLDEITTSLEALTARADSPLFRGRDGIDALRGRVEALRSLKRDQMVGEAPPAPTALPHLSDSAGAPTQDPPSALSS